MRPEKQHKILYRNHIHNILADCSLQRGPVKYKQLRTHNHPKTRTKTNASISILETLYYLLLCMHVCITHICKFI